MTWPSAVVNQINQLQGRSREIERTLLFIGHAGTSAPASTALVALDSQSDIDAVLASADVGFIGNVRAAQLNGGQNWQAWAAVLPAGTDAAGFVTAIRDAQDLISVEGVVIIRHGDMASRRAEVMGLQALRTELRNKYGRWLWFILGLPGIEKTQTWAAYLADVATALTGVAAPGVQAVPVLWGTEAGVLAGRLCDRSVTVADSPARVATGALLGLEPSLPQDSTGAEVTLAILRALHDLRCSVPMWYADFEGYYWSDGLMLEVNGGDYQVIEHVRIMDKVSRNIRIQAIGKIGNRNLNTTPVSIETHKTFFGRTLRAMSRSVQINGVTFPGEIEPPDNKAVSIVWLSKEQVSIGVVVRPHGCPKEITANIVLDTGLEVKG